jgi:hypothetical protein
MEIDDTVSRKTEFVTLDEAFGKNQVPSTKKERARPRASVTDGDDIPMATHYGILRIGECDIKCYVLDDSRRLLSGVTLLKAIGYSNNTGALTRMASNRAISKFFSDRLKNAIMNPVQFSFGGGRFVANGYEAWVLPELCSAIVDAAEIGVLQTGQYHIAVQSKLIIRALSVVGITALIDEATGFQNERAKDALSEILKTFISDELAKWAKVFPDDFYKELFRLKGLTYSDVSTKRPGFIGNVTNDIVYERLAPYVLEELKKITPFDESGRRKHKYFQRLTEDIGHEKLKNHLSSVIILMKASPNWTVFYRLLQRALPKWTDQLALSLEFSQSDDMDLPVA